MHHCSRQLALHGFWSGLVRGRQLAQDFIEFSLAIAAVAFVGMIGLNVLGGAEAQILGGKDTPNNPLDAPPPTGKFLNHNTSTSIDCGGQHIFYPSATINCTITVVDTHTPASADTPPGDQVHLTLNGIRIGVCNLTPTVGSYTTSTCVWSYTFKTTDQGVGKALVAMYDTPATDHNSSQSANYMLDVYIQLGFQFDCGDPAGSLLDFFGNPSPSMVDSWSTQFGSPLACRVRVRDISDNQWRDKEDVSLSSTAAAGWPYFSCWTNNQVSWVNNPNVCKQPSATWSCKTDSNGWCINADTGSAYFEYRLSLYDSQSLPPTSAATVQIVGSALGQSGASPNITINPNTIAHDSGALFHCTPPLGTTITAPHWTAVHPTTGNSGVWSDSTISWPFGTDLMMSCTAVVLDLGRNPTTFDNNCPTCNVDLVETTPPLGKVTTYIFDKTKCKVSGCDPATDLYTTQPPLCTLGHLAANPTVQSSVGPIPPLLFSGSYFPNQPTGQLWNGGPVPNGFVSWCSQTLTFPSAAHGGPGHYVVRASYNGFAGAHAPSSQPGSFASQDMPVDIYTP